MRVTVASPLLVTHSLPPATARSSGASADRDLRHAPALDAGDRVVARQHDPHGAARHDRVVRLAPDSERLALLLAGGGVEALQRARVGVGDQHAAARERDAVGPAVGGDRRRLRRAGGGGPGGRGSGWRRRSPRPPRTPPRRRSPPPTACPLKAGIVPAAALTVASTVAALGFRSSRFGPTLPFVPAAASVWQPPQLEVKTSLPSGARRRRRRPRPRRGVVVLRPDQRRPDEQREHGEGRRQPVTGARTRSMRRSTSGRGEAVLGDEPQPARQPRGDQEREQQAAGQRQRDRRAARASGRS